MAVLRLFSFHSERACYPRAYMILWASTFRFLCLPSFHHPIRYRFASCAPSYRFVFVGTIYVIGMILAFVEKVWRLRKIRAIVSLFFLFFRFCCAERKISNIFPHICCLVSPDVCLTVFQLFCLPPQLVCAHENCWKEGKIPSWVNWLCLRNAHKTFDSTCSLESYKRQSHTRHTRNKHRTKKKTIADRKDAHVHTVFVYLLFYFQNQILHFSPSLDAFWHWFSWVNGKSKRQSESVTCWNQLKVIRSSISHQPSGRYVRVIFCQRTHYSFCRCHCFALRSTFYPLFPPPSTQTLALAYAWPNWFFCDYFPFFAVDDGKHKQNE